MSEVLVYFLDLFHDCMDSYYRGSIWNSDSDAGSISEVGGPKTNDQIFFIYNQGRQWRSEKF